MKFRFGRLSGKLIKNVLFLNLFLIILVTLVQVMYTYAKAKKSISSTMQHIETSYLPAISNGLFKVDVEQLNLLLEGILRINNIEHAIVTETSGQNIFFLEKGQILSKNGIERTFPIIYNVNNNSISLGELKVFAGYSGITKQIIKDMSFLLTMLIMVAFVLSILMFVVFQNLVSRHISFLAKYTSSIKLTPDEPILKLNRKSNKIPDELDKLVRAINRMKARIHRGIQERDIASAALVKSESQLSLIVNHVSDLLALFKIEENTLIFETVNSNFISSFQKQGLKISKENILGKRLRSISEIVLQLSEENRKTLIEHSLNSAKTKEKSAFEFEQSFPKATIHLANLITPIIDSAGKCTHILYVGRDITEKKLFDKKMLNAIITTEEKEKSKFAKEIHDGLGPILSTAKLYTQSLKDEEDSEERKKILTRIFSTLEEALLSIKEISNNLSPHILRNFGLVRALSTFIDKVCQHQTIDISLNADFNKRFDDTIESTFYRVITELINNTLKHAKASSISISITMKKSKISLEYSDNGIGFDFNEVVSRNKGFGLINIQNRFNTLNGKIIFNSKPDKGMTVEAYLPVIQDKAIEPS
ncbi:MAG: hypothetical protein JXA77_16220 [Bacteroidales bacterium]|nr:hypothetical protein [Bacteroidales bacterium]MBN2818727.1 hypothetical protein [Bacteroidales bacterium]